MNRGGSRHGFETRFAYPLARRFAFYVADPLSSSTIQNFAHLLGFWYSFHGLIS